MQENPGEFIIPEEVVISKIYNIRSQKVMLDKDLAELYNVETKQLKRAVRRNIDRFPQDFMFELSDQEFQSLRSHFGTSKRGGTRYSPMAFTEQGVAMLSSVLNSDRAIKVNIQIIRAFLKLRKMKLSHEELLHKMERFERLLDGYGNDIKLIFDYLNRFVKEQEKPRTRIGFKQNKK